MAADMRAPGWSCRLPRLLLCAAAALMPVAGAAQAWPTKPVRFVAPFPPGGPVDLLARLIGQKVTEKSGQPVLVENRPGAAGNLGIELVAKAAPDGATLLHVPAGNITINATLMRDMPFNWDRDFVAVTMIATAPNLLAVHAGVPAKSLQELIGLAKASPGRLTYGSPGVGSGLHLSGELFRREAGIDIAHVPYKGTTQAMNDLLGGQITMMFGALPVLMPQVKAGKLRAIAVTSKARSPHAPEVPSIAESGVPGIDITSWYAIMAPAKTPPEIVAAVAEEVRRILALPEVRQTLDAQGLTPVGMRPADFAAHIRRETAAWARVIRDANIKPE
ncbi:MAG: tripartite tricarboxylate transporter substrate binding protein [Burkholderiales bacterium]|nr:tripartite tricarboxylate transporter substrate binding protein [Burkholderiales bacterium]